jgi:HD-GYP domain-containing protein (c-di-GMP phosphodiesterase class II)
LLKVEGAALAFRDPLTDEAVIELARGVWAHHTGLRLPPGDEEISGRIITIGQPYVNNDVRGDLFSTLSDRVNGLHAVAGAPLIAQKQTIGALWIGRGQSGQSALYAEITSDELRLLTAIADIAANAIHRVTLHEQTERRLRHVQALHANDRAISASLDLRLTLTVLLEQVTTQLGVDAAAVLLLHAPTQTLEYAAGRGFHTPVIQRTRRKLGEGHAGRAALEMRIVSLPDIVQSQEPFERAALMTGEFFTAYFAVPLVAKGQVKGVLEIFHRRPLAPDDEWLDFLDAVAGQAAIAIDNATLFTDLQRSNTELALAYDTTLEGWSRALDLRDKETEGHTRRVTEMTVRLAKAMGLGEAALLHLRRGALLHDIGKMGIPDRILLKPGPLIDDEWAVMRKHPAYAYDMLSPITYLRPALDIPYCHHEKWDGTGYPRGLKGEDIPLSARLFAVVDVWDALRSDRPYRLGWPEAKVWEHVRSLAGTHFDPQVVEVFLRVVNEVGG